MCTADWALSAWKHTLDRGVPSDGLRRYGLSILKTREIRGSNALKTRLKCTCHELPFQQQDKPALGIARLEVKPDYTHLSNVLQLIGLGLHLHLHAHISAFDFLVGCNGCSSPVACKQSFQVTARANMSLAPKQPQGCTGASLRLL